MAKMLKSADELVAEWNAICKEYREKASEESDAGRRESYREAAAEALRKLDAPSHCVGPWLEAALNRKRRK